MKFIHKLAPATFLLFICALPAFGQAHRLESFQGRDVVAGEIIVMFRPTAASARSAAARDDDTASVSSVGRNGAMVLRSRSRKTADLIQAYAGRPEVQYVEPNYVWHKTDVPNESLFPQQWALQNTGQTIQGQAGSPNADISAVLAWDKTIGSRNIVVGVVDSGIDYTHPDLAANVWTAPFAFDVTINGELIHCDAGTHGFNAITRTCDPMDEDGHGTIVSGIIGASGTNGFGITGISRVSSLMGLKFLDASGNGTTADAIAAIEFAIQVQSFGVNVRVLNNSWGGIGFSQALLDEINSANSHNMLFVASAGNESANNDFAPDYPANYNSPNVITVAATDNRDAMYTSSNFGVARVHLGAPGVEIESTHIHSSYGFNTGTSMSAAMVSGAAALVLGSCPLNTVGLKAALINTVDRLPSLAGKTVSGGRLNVNAAMNSCPGGISSFDFGANQSTFVGTASASGMLIVSGSNGFSGAVNLAALNLPAGVSANFNPPQIIGSGTSVLTLSIPPNFTPNTHAIQVLGSDGFISKSLGISLLVPPRITLSQSLNPSLSAADPLSPERPGTKADFFQFSLPASSVVTVDMRSTAFNPFLYLLSDSGTVMNSDDDGGGALQSRIGPILLAAGTYIVEATSSDSSGTGVYFIGVNVPTLDSVTPSSAQSASQVTLTFKANGFGTGAKANGFPGGEFQLSFIDSQTLVGTAVMDPVAGPGEYNVSVISQFGQSNKIPFTVTLATPVLTSMGPASGAPGTAIDVQLAGVGFTSTMSINAGAGITTSPISIFNTSAKIRFTIAANATLGVHDVTFSTAAGTSNALPLFITSSAPTLTSITPSSAEAGSAVTLTITGTNFIPGMTLQSCCGITFPFGIGVVSATQATGRLDTSSAAEFGVHDVFAVTSLGTSNPLPFTVTPAVPFIFSMIPNFGARGFSTDIVLTGTGFRSPLTLDMGSDITVGNLVIVDTGTVKATLNISSAAALGSRTYTVTTPGGISTTRTFNVVVPYPDLVVSVTPAGTFGQGFMETYNVLVRNIGVAPTSGVTKLTFDFTSGLPANTAAGIGAGWSCSTSGFSVVCLMSAPIASGAQSAVTFTISMGNLSGSIRSSFSVSNANELITDNNGASDFNDVVSIPRPTITPQSLTKSGSQVNIVFSPISKFPHTLTGKILLTFAPNPAVGVDDPAIQFSTGGRMVTFTIPANTTLPQYPGSGTLSLQSGTVAGVITLSSSLDLPPTAPPNVIPTSVTTLAPAAPVITEITKDSPSGAGVVVNMFSNARTVTSVTFAFNTTPGVLLSCGGVAGCSISGNTITFDARSIFSAWYAENVAYGGATSLRVPISIDGSLTGTVFVTISNTFGPSVARSYSLP